MVVEQGTGMSKTRRDGLRCATGPKIDGREVITRFIEIIATIDGVPKTELAVGIQAPALERIVVEQGARVTATRRDHYRRAPGPKDDGREMIAHFARIIAAISGVPKTKLTVGIRAPALERIVVEQGACMSGTRRDGLSCAAGTKIDGGNLPELGERSAGTSSASSATTAAIGA
jgi:hypothetical protein